MICNPETLKQAYESACNDYLKAFCEKQEMECGYWVGDIVGGIAHCSDFFFNFQDIVWDVNSNQPKGRIVEWYDYHLEEKNAINYFTYTKLTPQMQAIRLPKLKSLVQEYIDGKISMSRFAEILNQDVELKIKELKNEGTIS